MNGYIVVEAEAEGDACSSKRLRNSLPWTECQTNHDAGRKGTDRYVNHVIKAGERKGKKGKERPKGSCKRWKEV